MNEDFGKFLSDNVGLISILVVFVPVLLLLPMLIAVARNLPDRRKIALVNLAGTIFLTPWIVAMVWAVMGKPNESLYERILSYRRWIVGVALVGFVGFLIGIWFAWKAVEDFRNSDVTSRFVIQQVEAPPGSRPVLASGKIVPRSLVRVSSEVSGRIAQVLVNVNDTVVVGQPLLLIDSPNLISAVRQSSADLGIAQSEVEQAQADLATANARLIEQQAEYDRRRRVFERGFLSRADFEAAEAELRAREANVASSQARLRGAEGRKIAARARLAEARDVASRTTVVSPVSGTVLSRSAEPGQTVVSAFEAEELFQIAEDLGAMRLELTVDETEITQLREGQPVAFSVDAFPDQSFTGVLRTIERTPVVSDGTTAYRVFVDIENASGQFLSGMSVLAEFPPEKNADTLWIPAKALQFAPSDRARAEETGPSVYFVQGRGLRRAAVEVIGRSKAMVVIRSDALEIGDQLATGFRDADDE